METKGEREKALGNSSVSNEKCVRERYHGGDWMLTE